MTPRHLWLCLILLLALPVFPVFCQDPAISLPAGNTYEISPGARAVRVPLPDKPTITNPRVFDVALGTDRSPKLKAKFNSSMDGIGAFVISVTGSPLRQGTYDLKLQVTADGKDQSLNLRITQPAAQLRPPDTLVIQRFLGLWGDNTETPRLPLNETSGRSGLADVHVEQTGNLPGVSSKSGPVLAFTHPVQGIQAGRGGWVEYSLNSADGLPLGAVQGHAQVTSPQLAAPVPVTFEIRTRRTRWWIWFFAGFGLVCGLVLRTLLPRLVERDQALVGVVDALAEIDRERIRKDPQFQARLTAIYAKLKTTGDTEKNAQKLGQAVTDAKKDLSEALAELKVRLASALKDTESLDRLVKTGWFFPADLAAARSAAQPDLDAARQSLLESNAQAAEAALASARGHLAPLPQLLRDWPLRLEDLLLALGSPGLPVPSSMQAGLRDSVTYVRGLLLQVPDSGDQAAFDPLVQTLEAVDNGRRAARKLLLELRPGIVAAVNDVDLALRPVLAAGENLLQALRSEEPEKLGALVTAAEQPETAAPVVQETFLWLDRRLREALLALLDRIPADGQKAVRDKVDQRAYGDAAREIVRQIREEQAKAQAAAGGQGAGTALGGLPEETELEAIAAEAGTFWRGVAGLRFDPATWSPLRLGLDLSPEGLAAARARIAQELGWVTALRTALTWTGLLWLAYVIFHDKAGTLQDFAEVFFWGFGTDVTVDAFWNAAKGYKKV